MRSIIGWFMLAGGAVVALTAIVYFPAAVTVDDISRFPLAILIVILCCGVGLAVLGLLTLRRKSRISQQVHHR